MEHPYSAAVGSAIRAELARRRIPQAALGERLQLSRGQVADRLAGRIAWRLEELHSIALLLEIPVAQLVTAGPEVGVR